MDVLKVPMLFPGQASQVVGMACDLAEAGGPAAEWLADKVYDDKMGARPLGRVIQEHIKKPLAEELLFGRLSKGGVVKVGIKEGKIDLEIEGPAARRLTGKKTPPLLTAE